MYYSWTSFFKLAIRYLDLNARKKVKKLEKQIRIGTAVASFWREDDSEIASDFSLHKGMRMLNRDESLELIREIGKRFRHHYYGKITKVTECPPVDDGEGGIVEKLMVELDGGQLKFLFPTALFLAHQWPKEGAWILIHFNYKNAFGHACYLFDGHHGPAPSMFLIEDQDLIDVDS